MTEERKYAILDVNGLYTGAVDAAGRLLRFCGHSILILATRRMPEERELQLSVKNMEHKKCCALCLWRCSLKAFALSIALLLAPALFAQNAKPNAPDEHPQPCVIAKRHVHKFGENMSRLHPHRPLDYIEGDYPAGFK